jgi:formylglycine-generating enzyme required for sulfatase activity
MSILDRNLLVRQILTRTALAAVLALSLGAMALAADKDKPAGGAAAELTDIPAVKWMPKPYPVPNADAQDEAAMKPYTEALVNADIKFNMVPIKGGTFTLGSPAGEKGRKADEGPQVKIALEPFWMGTHEVTWEEYETWSFDLDKQRRKAKQAPDTEWDKLGDAIARPTKPYTDMTFDMGKTKCPAICMTHYSAQMYCKWLTAKTGRYYRLPTEAEWEYACRAGSKTAFFFGDDPKKLGDFAWFAGNSNDRYHKVGLKKPNPWGLYDMHGNVCEFVLDQLAPDTYQKLANQQQVKNPLVPGVKEYPRAARGGSWQDDPEALRSAARRGSAKDWKMQDPQIPQSIWFFTDATFAGFRVVRPLRTPTEQEAKLYEPDPKVRQAYKEAQGGKT